MVNRTPTLSRVQLKLEAPKLWYRTSYLLLSLASRCTSVRPRSHLLIKWSHLWCNWGPRRFQCRGLSTYHPVWESRRFGLDLDRTTFFRSLYSSCHILIELSQVALSQVYLHRLLSNFKTINYRWNRPHFLTYTNHIAHLIYCQIQLFRNIFTTTFLWKLRQISFRSSSRQTR